MYLIVNASYIEDLHFALLFVVTSHHCLPRQIHTQTAPQTAAHSFLWAQCLG